MLASIENDSSLIAMIEPLSSVNERLEISEITLSATDVEEKSVDTTLVEETIEVKTSVVSTVLLSSK